MTQIATADTLFGQPLARRYKTVGPLPVKGVCPRIRSLNEVELADYQLPVMSSRGNTDARLRDAQARLICMCLVDADGNPIAVRPATDGRPAPDPARVQDILANWDSADSLFLYDACIRHLGMRRGELEDLVKNSAADPSSASSPG